MEYVDFPFEEGFYEIYLSFSGLESNRARVQIVFDTEVRVMPEVEEELDEI